MKSKTFAILVATTCCSVSHISAELTRRWALNEYTLVGGILESVSGSTAGALFGDATGVIGNPGVDAADRAYLFKGNAANNGGNAVSTEITNVLPATGNFSVFVTAKFATNYQGGGRMLFSNNNGQGGRIDFAIDGNAATPNRLSFFYGGTTNMSISFADSVVSPVLFDGGWHEVGVTRSGTTYQLYVDGVARGAAGTSSLGISTNTVYRIGRRNAFTGFFNNAISEVQVFDDARTTGLPILAYDFDGDNIADSWEIRYFAEAGEDPVADLAAILARCAPGGDLDGDGLDNLAEFNAGSHPGNPDTDGDGLGDGVETGTGTWVSAADTGTNRLKPDSDGDGLLDGQENNSGTYVSVTNTGTNPNLADTDGDTFNDYLEISRGSDPTQIGSTPGAFASNPLVALNAVSLTVGPLPAWSNTGTLGRGFAADTEPAVELIGGIKGVTFSGTEVLTGPVAPSNLTGSSPRTIRAWIFNPTTSSEETIVAWGRRGGPNGTSCAFFHGTNASFGAVGNWGTPDMPWGTDAAAIASNVKIGGWTYVVYTYDGGASNVGNVYSNGSLANTKLLGALATIAVDNTAAVRPLPIRVAGQNAANGTLAADGQKGSHTIHRIEIHDRVLSAADLGFNDTDSDGMLDWYEDFYGLDKNVPDGDGDPDIDGLTNLQEQAAGTNPTVADSDGDGMPDGWDLANFGNQAANPNDDPDNDGSLNIEEFQALTRVTINRDVNGAITGTTPAAGSSNPNDPDSQPDDDEDTLPDGWEFINFLNLTEGPEDDFDLDTFTNWEEFLAGSDPTDELSVPGDIDGDGISDAWEKLYFGNLNQGPSGDFDNDGASNLAEFQGESDPTDPASQPDNDDDDLPDGWENLHFGNLNQGPTDDFDGDGFNNAAELAAGSNPARVRSTPDNVNDTVQVAIATSAGIDEYSVQNNVWTFVRQITGGETTSLVFHEGSIIAASPASIRQVNPATGTAVTLVTRNEGDALTAGWTTATARGMEIGPDGKLYLATAFGAANGQGVFRMNIDGSGFEEFIPRVGADYELSNAIDLAWKDADTLFVTSRGAFDATNRFVYQFDASGDYVATIANTLQGPQGLFVDGNRLWVTGTNGSTALVALDLTATPPLTPQVVRTGGATNPEVEEILGELHVVTFAGNIRKDVFKPSLQTVLASVGEGVNANDMVVFESTATPYDTWAAGFGIDPTAPNGGPAADFEGDGTPNGVEFALGLNPTDGTSRFAITTTGSAATGLTLTWPSAEGISFEVRSSTDLVDWSTLEGTVVGQADATTATWTAPAATPGARKFYRVGFTP
jgi:hypothetical protein